MGENRLSDPQRVSEASYLPYITGGSAWIAEANTGILGFGAIDVPKATIWALFINPDAQGCGIGQALHHQMIDWAGKKGLGRLYLRTGKGTRAVDFYRRAGWTEVGVNSDGEVLFEMTLRE